MVKIRLRRARRRSFDGRRQKQQARRNMGIIAEAEVEHRRTSCRCLFEEGVSKGKGSS